MKKIIGAFMVVMVLVGCSNNSASSKSKKMTREEIIEELKTKDYSYEVNVDNENELLIMMDNTDPKVSFVYYVNTTNNQTSKELLFKDFNVNDTHVNVLTDSEKFNNEEKQQFKAYETWLNENNLTNEQLSSLFVEYRN